MGTNFYIGKTHIGKRSAAGRYCYKCNQTLAERNRVHSYDAIWYEECPVCGEQVETTCCSFTYAVTIPELNKLLKKGAKIKDEYGKRYSKEQLLKEILDCPIKFFLLSSPYS